MRKWLPSVTCWTCEFFTTDYTLITTYDLALVFKFLALVHNCFDLFNLNSGLQLALRFRSVGLLLSP